METGLVGPEMRIRHRGSAVGAAAIVMSLGIYQSYFPVAAVLMVGALLFETLDGKRSFRELFLRGVRLAGTLAVAMVVYMIVARIAAGENGLADYKGISNMGQISLREIPRLVFESYRGCITFFLSNSLGWHFGFLKFAFVAVGLCSVALGVLLVRERHLEAAQVALAVALVVVYPLACALIYVMSAGAFVHTVMIYGFVYILVLPIAMADYAEISLKRFPLQAAASWVILLTMVLTAYSYAVTDNNGYLKADLSMRQCAAYSNRLLERVEACEGYEPGMSIVLLGSDVEGDWLSPTPELDSVNITGILDLGEFRTSWNYDYFLRYFVGFAGQVYTDFNWSVTSPFEAMDEVQAMPVYPEAGSIQIFDGTVVVKLSD
ncbi:MAG: glucosyltransferase domain-containing protein [Oscillospiraceae bacterium]|nr:glucosyltransferase domain-containing protein [Oscillospiraceae bacterium]